MAICQHLTLALVSLTIATTLAQRPVNEKVNQKCIDDYKEQKPTLAARFTDTQIAWFCQTGKFWKAGASVKKDLSQDQQMTTGQLDFLNRLRTCKGIKCLQKAGLKNVYRPRPPKPPPGVAADFPSTPDFLQTLYDKVEAFDATSVRLDDHLSDMRVHIIFDGVLFDAEHPLCDERVQMAELCPQAIETEHFNKIIAMTPDGQPSERQAALMDLCNVMNRELDSYGLDFKSLEACKSERVFGENRRIVAQACFQLTSATHGAEAFPDFAARTAWLRSDKSKQILLESLQQKYEELKRHCEYLQQSVEDSGLGSMSEWLEPGPGRWRRQADPDRVPDIQLLTNGLFYRPIERREYRALSAFDRVRFHAALNQFKYEQIDGISKYDLLVLYHTPSESPGAYWGPGFLPHHREWLKAFVGSGLSLEIGLRLIDPAVAVPFWDSTLDEPLPQPKESLLWSDEFMGNGDGLVTVGDFQSWPATNELPFLPGTMTLYRDVGTSPYGGLYLDSDVAYVLASAGYNELTACVDPTFELTQGLVHMFVGGYMADIATSPNDPVFMLHHSYVDYLWEKFRTQKQSRDERETQYPSDDMACTEHHYAEAQMKPFPITNIDGLSNIYTDEMYRYEFVDMGSSRDCDFCNYDYMFCHPELNRCVSKIRPGGDCTGYSGDENLAVNACYQSICSGDTNKCEPTDERDDEKVDTETRSTTTSTASTPIDTVTDAPAEPDTTTSTFSISTTTTEKQVPVKVTTPEVIEVEDTTTKEGPLDQDTTTTTAVPEPEITTTKAVEPEPVTETTTVEPEPETTTTDMLVDGGGGGGGDGGMVDAGWPTPPSPDFNTVWFAFSIIRGTSVPSTEAEYESVPSEDVTITATGLNLPNGYTQQTQGVAMSQATNLQNPLYPYGAYVQVMDPLTDTYRKIVEFKLEVTSATGGECEMQCYLRLKKSYGKCPNSVWENFQMSINISRVATRGDKIDQLHPPNKTGFACPHLHSTRRRYRIPPI